MEALLHFLNLLGLIDGVKYDYGQDLVMESCLIFA